MSSYDVAKLEAALGMHSLKPIDPEAKRVKIKRVTRHKGFNSRTLVSFVLFLSVQLLYELYLVFLVIEL